jgi:uncharacterized protein YqeY
MTLKEQLMRDMQDAMRSGDELRKQTIRMARAAIQSAETEARTKLFESGASTEDIEARSLLDDAGVQAVLQKAIKQRRESAEEYTRANRTDLAEKELAEVSVLEAYLPKQMGDEEIEAEVAAVIAEVGASSLKDISKVMPAAMSRLKGRADGRAVNRAVSKLLSQDIPSS